MSKDEPCQLSYKDTDGDTIKKEAPITSIKTDAFGLTFFDTSLSMLTTVTWDKIESFEIKGKPSVSLIEKSKSHQHYYSDDRKRRGGVNVSM